MNTIYIVLGIIMILAVVTAIIIIYAVKSTRDKFKALGVVWRWLTYIGMILVGLAGIGFLLKGLLSKKNVTIVNRVKAAKQVEEDVKVVKASPPPQAAKVQEVETPTIKAVKEGGRRRRGR
jgi:type VI protein secretion system component VasK